MNWIPDESVAALIALARQEDLGDGDITTALVPNANAATDFALIARQNCVLAGREVAEQILAAYDPGIKMQWNSGMQDGDRIDTAPTKLATLRGSLGSILAAERILLNFLQRLCGVATLTRAFVDAAVATGAAIYDTRKTTPGWRTLEKYAVRCGGGKNHRQGLYDAVLIKDNHLAGVQNERLAGTLFEMLSNVGSAGRRPSFIAVEAVNLDQVRELCKVVGINVILLDNFPIPQLAEAVHYRDAIGLRGKIDLEASGGVTLQTLRSIAETGVERISVGAITHSAPSIDMALERL